MAQFERATKIKPDVDQPSNAHGRRRLCNRRAQLKRRASLEWSMNALSNLPHGLTWLSGRVGKRNPANEVCAEMGADGRGKAPEITNQGSRAEHGLPLDE